MSSAVSSAHERLRLTCGTPVAVAEERVDIGGVEPADENRDWWRETHRGLHLPNYGPAPRGLTTGVWGRACEACVGDAGDLTGGL